MWSRMFIVVLMWASAAAPASAQSPEAERSFRAHAQERVQILRSSRDGRERADAAEYLGGFEYPDVIAALESRCVTTICEQAYAGMPATLAVIRKASGREVIWCSLPK